VTTGADVAVLLAALDGLGGQLRDLSLPLEVSDVAAARALRQEIADQLEDYVLPRLRRIDAPVLAVVGGPTGAGKSTLVNSLVGQRVSAAGVLRPTTRSAILAYHPADSAWFENPRILPSLGRTTGASSDPASLQLVPSPSMPVGLAVLDAPDIDSVVTANRELATQLLAAADMWLFVTTAARYADAVPWEYLRMAVTRGTAVAIVLDRVGSEAVEEVRAHLATMLTEQGLGGAPLFVVPETNPVGALLPAGTVDKIRQWLQGIAGDPAVRTAVVRHTLNGAVRSLSARVFLLAAASDEQAETASRLRREVDQAYDAALARVDESSGDGSLLRGEVLARWQEFVGTGELMRALESKIGRLRDRLTAAVQGKVLPGDGLAEALETGVEALVRTAADEAAERAGAAWQDDPAGAVLLGADDLRRSSPEFPEATARAVRDWQGGVLDLVRAQGQGKRATARYLAFGVNGLGVLVMIVVFAHTGGLAGGEVAVAGGASVISQKILEAVLGDQVVRSLAATSRADLHRRVKELLNSERGRFLGRLVGVAVSEDAGPALRAAVQDIEDAR
jgi:GTPase SAR1 family protein